MNQTILFSPVGGTDPVAESNMRDGSLLHICRVYKPDKVILFMSQEIIKKHEEDNRYLRGIEKLGELQKKDYICKVIRREDLSDVQNFDYYYNDFHSILSDIFHEMDDTDRLILNISSGTPAMKSSLVVLCTMGEIPALMIQVKTPERKMNQHVHTKEYDLDTLWDLNEDNAEDFENRCEEIHCPVLSDLLKKEIIKKHVQAYDYQAALVVAGTLSEQNKELSDCLQMAAARYMLKRTVDRYLSNGIPYKLPVSTSKYRDAFEYALLMQIKLQKEEFADFVRSISPLLMDLFTFVLENQCRIRLSDYCRFSDGVLSWSRNKLADTDLLRILTTAYAEAGRNFDYSWVRSDNLMHIIIALVDDNNLKNYCTNLRKVEFGIRNLAAHEIVAISDETIIKKTGFSGKQIMEMIKKLFHYTGANVKTEHWNSYNDMNGVIIGLLK